MSCGSSMLAMIFSWPPQRVQFSISTPNTRFSRLAQLIATCRGVDGLVGSAPDTVNWRISPDFIDRLASR